MGPFPWEKIVDLLRSVLFESVVLLLIAEVVAIAVALALHRRSFTARTRRGVYVTVAVCLLLLVLQYLVQTDREQVEAAVARIALAIDEGDVPTVADHLDSSFTDQNLNRTAWIEDLRQRLQRWRIDEAKVGGFSTEVQGDSAVTSFRASCDWRGGDQAPQTVVSSWKLSFVRRPDGWKLERVVSAKFGPGGMLDYANIRQY